jgi:hypothetical protein
MNYPLKSKKSQPSLSSQLSVEEVKSFKGFSDILSQGVPLVPAGGSGRVSCQEIGKTLGSAPRGEHSEPLLHLNSNICTENTAKTSDEKTLDGLTALLSPYSKRVAFALQENVKRLLSLAPDISYLGFLTLTFKENVTCPKEASRKFHSFNTHFLMPSPNFSHWLAVRERQKRGAWHYHILVILKSDVRTGFNWQNYDAALKFRDPKSVYRSKNNKAYRDYMRAALKTASPELKKYWQELRLACAKYGFGRSEMLPIKSNVKAMTLYVGKYISKELGERDKRDKGVRLINYSKGWVKNSSNFQWNTDGSQEWRRKLRLFARLCGCDDMYNLNKKLGSSWAYHYLEDIVKMDDFIYSKKLDPEKIVPEDIPEELNLRMLKHQNAREAKKIKTCPICKRKSRWQWQGNELFCCSCGSLIF